MATRTIYLTGTTVSGANFLSGADTAPTAAPHSPETSVQNSSGSARAAAGESCSYYGHTIRAVNQFNSDSTSNKPTAPDNANAHLYRLGPFTATLAASSWTVSQDIRVQTNNWTGDSHLIGRIYKGANADGSGATEIGGGRTNSTLQTADVNSGNSFVPTISFSVATQLLNNEYLFVQIAHYIDTQRGASANCVFALREGSTSFLTIGDYVAGIMRAGAGIVPIA